uniref:Uncharacterized protein n=1 Tax=Caenorhabditis japonica TaxID=281687 RepID=A0A8R1E0J5_CAEJA
MYAVLGLTLFVASTQAFLFGPGGLGGLFGPPAGACDPCAAARAAQYYPPQQPAYQAPAYQAPAYPAPRPIYSQPAPVYQTAPAYHPEPAPVQYQQVVAEPVAQVGAGAGGYVQPPPPPPPASYVTEPRVSGGYKKF